ncbi:MAG TPA: GDSL-type esterase/lipase family protein [Acidimicrobiales bacterium]
MGVRLLAYVAACWLFIALRHRSLFLAILALFGVVASALALDRVVRSQVLGRPEGCRRFLLSLTLPVAGGVLMVAGWLSGADGWRFFGFAVTYLGFGVAVEQLRTEGVAERWHRPALLATGGLTALGLVVLAVTGWTVGAWLAAAGLGLLPVGVALATATVTRSLGRRPDRRRAVMAAVGASLFAAALIWMAALGVGGPHLVLVAAALLLLVLAIGSRTNTDVVLVVAMAAVVWTLTHRTVPTTDPTRADRGETVMAALGDSYMSGEGADAFFEGTNRKGDNECRQAPTAFAALLALDRHEALADDLLFLACSGADTADVRTQVGDLVARRDADGLEVKVVLLSVGGNDAGFGTVGRTCLLAGDCSELAGAWMANLGELAERLGTLYGEVRAAVGEVPVVVVPYPIPIARASCAASTLTDAEHRFLHDFAVALDEVVAAAAADAGFYVVDTMPDAFAGMQVCPGDAADAAVNFFALNTVVGTLEQSANPLNWWHNSLHPNQRGHERMRAALTEWLGDRTALPPRSEAAAARPPSDTGPTAVARGGACTGKTGHGLHECSERWMRREIGQFALTKGLLLLAAAVGVWLLTVPLILFWRENLA